MPSKIDAPDAEKFRTYTVYGLSKGEYDAVVSLLKELPDIVLKLEAREYICELGMLDGDSDFKRLKHLAEMMKNKHATQNR